MGVLRVGRGVAVGLAVVIISACSSREAAQASEPEALDADSPRVPDPPPRYKRLEMDSGITVPSDDSEPTLQIRCGGDEPYVCPLDDGTFRCSHRPCIPDCSRVGCLGGEECRPCDGAFQCMAAGETC